MGVPLPVPEEHRIKQLSMMNSWLGHVQQVLKKPPLAVKREQIAGSREFMAWNLGALEQGSVGDPILLPSGSARFSAPVKSRQDRGIKTLQFCTSSE